MSYREVIRDRKGKILGVIYSDGPNRLKATGLHNAVIDPTERWSDVRTFLVYIGTVVGSSIITWLNTKK